MNSLQLIIDNVTKYINYKSVKISALKINNMINLKQQWVIKNCGENGYFTISSSLSLIIFKM